MDMHRKDECTFSIEAKGLKQRWTGIMCTRASGKLRSVLMEALSQDTLLAGDESSAKCAKYFSNI